jgi:hypothetical protein
MMVKKILWMIGIIFKVGIGGSRSYARFCSHSWCHLVTFPALSEFCREGLRVLGFQLFIGSLQHAV